MAGLSPMMQQYLNIKDENPDCILFFRLGDFYEMFFEDAVTASTELDLTLTGKDCGLEKRAPMCGVPYHASETYIAKLVERGYKVAICEQTENPATAKGLVKREVIRIITPGTVIESTMLDEGKNNYLCAVSFTESGAGICFVDASTGEAHLTEVLGKDADNRLVAEISRMSPSEILIQEGFGDIKELNELLKKRMSVLVTQKDSSYFKSEKTRNLLLKHFSVSDSSSLGVTEGSLAEQALGGAIRYLYETGISGDIVVKKVDVYSEELFMKLDITAIRNLELTETMRTKSKKGSLLWAMDKTRTAMGKRLLVSWLEQPLLSINEIGLRHNAVDELFGDVLLRGEISEYLSGIRDIERTMARIVYGSANARDLRTLSNTLNQFPLIKNVLSSAKCRMLKEIYDDIDCLPDILELIESAIVEEPPLHIKEGGMIKKDYNAEIAELHNIMENGTGIIAEIEQREREATGIKGLKVNYNRVFGYYIEVTNSFLSMVPETYIRKQTLTGCERFITEELKQLEGKLLGAKDKLFALEYSIFDSIRKKTAEQLSRFQRSAAALARLDVLCSFASVAAENNYCRPRINTDGKISIVGGRHPVVEKLSDTPFVANDTFLNSTDRRCAIITGPNMAGKSTYMRQVAIITLLAQVGSFVPATSADISVCDAIFTRVGASDDLSTGQSTFMVEMTEVAYILKHATNKSLLILDEIGRGTSTYDGMSIARAVLECVADKRKIGAKALFATHYHELTELENEVEGIKNFNIAVKKRGDDIIFLRKIIEGAADDSYGIEVAKLAGMPSGVIKRAKDILKDIENNGIISYRTAPENSQMPLELRQATEIFEELKVLDVNTLTPMDAMRILYDLADKAKE